jgi:hypothetical protein
MLLNYVNQLRLQARTGGWDVPLLDDAAARGDVGVIAGFVREGTRRTGERHGVLFAEEFRVVRFGGMEALLDATGRRR